MAAVIQQESSTKQHPKQSHSPKQAQQKQQHDQHARLRMLEPGQHVMVRDKRPNTPTWIPGVIVQQRGPLTFLVDVEQGQLWKRHLDHLRQFTSDDDFGSSLTPTSSLMMLNHQKTKHLLLLPIHLPDMNSHLHLNHLRLRLNTAIHPEFADHLTDTVILTCTPDQLFQGGRRCSIVSETCTVLSDM